MIGSTRYTAGLEIQRQSKLASDIAKLQESVSTKQRMTAASDDPKAASRVADIRQDQSNNAAWTRNLDIGAGIAKASSTALTSLATMMQRAKELIIAGSNDTNANIDRGQIATELRSIAANVTSLSQSRDPNGQPLFPTGDPLKIPIGSGRSLAATASSAEVFDTVSTAHGDRSIVAILTFAADALGLTADQKIPYANPDGTTVDPDGKPLEMTRTEALAASVAAIGNADDRVRALETDQGLRGQRFDDEKAAIGAADDDLTVERMSLEETDMTYAIAAFKSKSIALDAAQSMFAQTHRKSLFDLIG